jgi:hypothetical protein
MDDKERIAQLGKLLDVKIAGVQAIIEAKSIAQKEAITKAEIATEKRFDSVNEFRGQLNDTIAQFATREALTASIEKQEVVTSSHLLLINAIDRRLATLEGKMLVYVSVGSALATFLAGLFSWLGHSLHQ